MSVDEANPGPHVHYRLNEPWVIADTVDGDTVIMNLAKGSYYGLDPVAAVAWQWLLLGVTPAAVSAAIARHFAADAEIVLEDLGRFIAQLLAEELVVVAEAPADSEVPLTLSPAMAAYQAPCLRCHADMANLLALDPPLPAS